VREAVLFDIHGNVDALEAVLAEADALGCEGLVLGGDYAFLGPAPAECVDRLRDDPRPAVAIRGNTDRMIAEGGYMRRDWQICDAQILGKSCIAAPLKPGGVLLFDGLLVHGTPHNGSAMRRRAVQFHYHGNRFPKIENDARMAVYGGEGANVEC